MLTRMLTRWEWEVLLDKLHDLEVNPGHLRVVKHRVEKRLVEAFRDMQLIYAVFPDLQNVKCYRCSRHQSGAGGGI